MRIPVSQRTTLDEGRILPIKLDRDQRGGQARGRIYRAGYRLGRWAGGAPGLLVVDNNLPDSVRTNPSTKRVDPASRLILQLPEEPFS